MTIEDPLVSLGIKPNPSYFHNTMRIVVLIMLLLFIVMIYYADMNPRPNKNTTKEIDIIARPGTKMYDIIMDMDNDARELYTAALQQSISATHQMSKMHKLIKTIATTLFVGFVADYVIHGNVNKVMSTTGRTSLTATLTALT